MATAYVVGSVARKADNIGSVRTGLRIRNSPYPCGPLPSGWGLDWPLGPCGQNPCGPLLVTTRSPTRDLTMRTIVTLALRAHPGRGT